MSAAVSARRILFAALLLTLAARDLSTIASADDTDARYFEQLRSRGLFSIAESVCRRRLQDDQLIAPDRTELSIELARTYAAHARSHPDEKERASLWDAAAEVLKVARSKVTETDLRFQLAVHEGLVTCDRAEFDQLLADVNPYDRHQQARLQAMRERALRELEQLEATLQASLQRASSGKSAAPFKPLLKLVQFQAGSLWIAHGANFPANNPDRSNAWLHAEQKLKRVASSSNDERVTWVSQLALARLMRLKSEFERAETMLNAIERDQPPADLADETLAERVELYAVTRRLPDAAELLKAYRRQHLAAAKQASDKTTGNPQVNGRLSFLAVRVWLDLATFASLKKDDALADDLRAEARRWLEQNIDAANGYWAHRSRLIWEQHEEARRLGDSVAQLLREARGRFAAGDVAESLVVFRRAFDEAVERDTQEASFDIGLSLARLQLERRDALPSSPAEAKAAMSARIDELMALLDRMLELHAAHPRVAEVALLRAICLGRRYQMAPSKPARDNYVQALMAHVDRYPESPTAVDAAWMLAQLQEKLTAFESALKYYSKIPAEHARTDEALAGAARCYRQLVTLQRTKPNDARDWSSEAISKLSRLADDISERSELNPSQWEFLLQTALIGVTHEPLPSATLDWIKKLDRVVSSADDNSKTDAVHQVRQRAVTQLKVLLTARRNSAIDSQARVSDLKIIPTIERVTLLLDCESQLKHLGASDRRALSVMIIGALQHAVLDNPSPNRATQATIERLLWLHYDAIGDAVNARAAQQRFERLKQ